MYVCKDYVRQKTCRIGIALWIETEANQESKLFTVSHRGHLDYVSLLHEIAATRESQAGYYECPWM